MTTRRQEEYIDIYNAYVQAWYDMTASPDSAIIIDVSRGYKKGSEQLRAIKFMFHLREEIADYTYFISDIEEEEEE